MRLMKAGLFAFVVMFTASVIAEPPQRGAEDFVRVNKDLGTIDGRFVALLVYAQNYKHWTPLKTPRKDVEKLKAVLEKRYLFDQVHVLEDPSAKQLDDALRARVQEAGEKDSLLVYYAGHGHNDELTKQGYWVPVTARRGTPADYVLTDTVKAILGASKARHVALISDSCFSGKLLGKRSGQSIKDAEYADYYKRRSFDGKKR